jgi:hypothetical protein
MQSWRSDCLRMVSAAPATGNAAATSASAVELSGGLVGGAAGMVALPRENAATSADNFRLPAGLAPRPSLGAGSRI